MYNYCLFNIYISFISRQCVIANEITTQIPWNLGLITFAHEGAHPSEDYA